MENKAFGLFCVMVRVQNVLCSFFVCQILYEKRRCFGISKDVHQLNEDIRDSEIRLIGSTGEQLGIMSAAQAQHIADEQGLDLVKISPQATPPVCKLMDYGKFRFEQGKREKEARKNQKIVELKEIRLSMTIDEGDIATKAKNAVKFLKDGDKVKVSLRMRGRQMAFVGNGIEVANSFYEKIKDYATIEKKPLAEGRFITMVLAPVDNKNTK